MKDRVSRLLLILCGLGMLAFPRISSAGASSGLLQWYQSVLPVLLPFLLLARLISALFPLSQNRRRISLLLLGFLCGYPMGAILVGNEVKDGRFTPEEGQRILNVCNLPSPAFLLGLVAVQWLNLTVPIRLLASVWLSALAFGLLTLLVCRVRREFIPRASKNLQAQSAAQSSPPAFSIALLERAWMESCRVAVIIGCYMVLFGILSSWLTALPHLPQEVRVILLLICEITTGCKETSASLLPLSLRETMCAAGAAFGGLSCLAQTSGCIQGTGMKMTSYTRAKLCSAGLAVLINLALQRLLP